MTDCGNKSSFLPSSFDAAKFTFQSRQIFRVPQYLQADSDVQVTIATWPLMMVVIVVYVSISSSLLPGSTTNDVASESTWSIDKTAVYYPAYQHDRQLYLTMAVSEDTNINGTS